ncbi:MAG TPA: nuclear transport factor 2 family protein [Candidatus Limnocylindrales bacterium]|nr:nuclear transport factor 2 family protein [Candidatus Limnocylindrales bacterium]
MSQDLVRLLQPLLGGAHALGVGGSRAKDSSDEHSDLDLYLFAESLAGEDKITAVLSGVADLGRVDVGGDLETLWGRNIDFRLNGDLVEVTVRSVAHIERILADCEAGVVRAEPMVWTPGGFFYHHAALADLTSIRSLADPHGLIARWQERLTTYPPALRRAVIGRHLPRASFWLDNPHYRGAIARVDVPYAQSIVMNTVHDLMHVLYAVNERYYCGEKRLLAQAESLPTRPADLPEKLAWLVMPGEAATAELLERQRLGLVELVRATKLLAAGDPDEPEAVVQRQLEAYNAHDLEAYLATFAEDVQLERHGEVTVGLEAMRARYAPIFAAGRCRAEISARMRQGEWIVDRETAYGLGPEPVRVLVAYRVRGGVIDRVRFMA